VRSYIKYSWRETAGQVVAVIILLYNALCYEHVRVRGGLKQCRLDVLITAVVDAVDTSAHSQ